MKLNSNSSNSPLSFRDPLGSVQVQETRVIRRLTNDGHKWWGQLKADKIIEIDSIKSRLISTKEIQVDGELALEHEKIHFPSYCYEWPFSLLKKAALLHLDLLLELLPKGYTLKDASPFNVQFSGVKPIFIDVTSIEKRIDGDPWVAQNQFLELMLYPLMLTSYKKIPFQNWIKGNLQGLSAHQMNNLFSFSEMFKPGVFFQIKLQHLLQKIVRKPTDIKRKDLQKIKIPLSVIIRNVESLKKLIQKLHFRDLNHSDWSGYMDSCSYSEQEMKLKKSFIEDSAQTVSPKSTLDIGCNTGEFSIAAANFSNVVISVDQDPTVVENLASLCNKQEIQNISPLVQDWSSPSSGFGWNGEETIPFLKRNKFDLILYLAVTHHLRVTKQVPLDQQIQVLNKLGRFIVFEFIDKDDPMFKLISTNIDVQYPDYSKDSFKKIISSGFKIEKELNINSTRSLFLLKNIN